MIGAPRFRIGDWLGLLVVVALAVTTRSLCVSQITDNGSAEPHLMVQGKSLDVARYGWFGEPAPLSEPAEVSAHAAPGYAWLYELVSGFDASGPTVMRWLQCALGVLTVVCYYFFARRAFQNASAAFLAGLLTALHPFWILNTAELNNGVLTTFLLSAVLLLGSRGGESGGAFVSLLFGLALAGLAMTRAALLPFAMVGLLWFLWRCRSLKMGWFCALLALLGFGNGLAPWTVRNFRQFGEPVLVADSAFLHLWIGNHPGATGGPVDEAELRATFAPGRLKSLLDEPNQARRYAMLGHDTLHEVESDPGAFFTRRLAAGLNFLFGESWFSQKKMALEAASPPDSEKHDWLLHHREGILQGVLLAMLILGGLGWRFSHGWRNEGRLAALALLWLPLPYVLSHGDLLSGPRLPLDGVLLCYSAFALSCLVPGTLREPLD